MCWVVVCLSLCNYRASSAQVGDRMPQTLDFSGFHPSLTVISQPL
jgi:hypothetical protein